MSAPGFLNKGITLASLKLAGTWPVSKDLFKRSQTSLSNPRSAMRKTSGGQGSAGDPDLVRAAKALKESWLNLGKEESGLSKTGNLGASLEGMKVTGVWWITVRRSVTFCRNNPGICYSLQGKPEVLMPVVVSTQLGYEMSLSAYYQ